MTNERPLNPLKVEFNKKIDKIKDILSRLNSFPEIVVSFGNIGKNKQQKRLEVYATLRVKGESRDINLAAHDIQREFDSCSRYLGYTEKFGNGHRLVYRFDVCMHHKYD